MPPGTAEQLHYHQFAQQVFYVLSGMATFEMEGKTISVRAGQSLHIPKTVKHRILNKSSEDLHFLVISELKAHGDRVSV